MQISLREKLDSNPNYLNEYAESYAQQNMIKANHVCSNITSHFIESPTFVRENLDSKFKNQSKVSKQSKLTRLTNHIKKLQEELRMSEAVYETLVFNSK